MKHYLSASFTLDEFTRSSTAAKHGIENIPTSEHLANMTHTAEQLERVRAYLGVPILIMSGYRNPQVNALVGGVPTSDHALGFAIDLRVAGMPSRTLARKILASGVPFDQLIHETSRKVVHLSFAPRMRGQVLTQEGGAGTPFRSGL